jgi:hypothetical protein
VFDEVSSESRLAPEKGRRIGLQLRTCRAAHIAPVFSELRHAKHETIAENHTRKMKSSRVISEHLVAAGGCSP